MERIPDDGPARVGAAPSSRHRPAVRIYFVTHATSVDNEARIASGRLDCGLSARGRAEAAALPARVAGLRFGAVFCSSLRRSIDTAEIAFGGGHPIRRDARLDEIDYGDCAGMPVPALDKLRGGHIDTPFPNGESYRRRTALVEAFLSELRREPGDDAVLIVGHRATKWALDVLLDGRTLDAVVTGAFEWRAVWHYALTR